MTAETMNVRIHRKSDGLLLVLPDGSCRFLTMWERVQLALSLTTAARLAGGPTDDR
jgi:hypothetical protein